MIARRKSKFRLEFVGNNGTTEFKQKGIPLPPQKKKRFFYFANVIIVKNKLSETVGHRTFNY